MRKNVETFEGMKKGMIFGPFRSENGPILGIDFAYFGLEYWAWFSRGTMGVHERICRFNSK